MGLSPRIEKLDAGNQLIINAGMDLFQRGTTTSVSNAANTYLADRFSFRPAGITATATMARSTDVPTLAQSGYQYPYSLGLTTTNQVASPGSTAVASLAYRMEGQDYAPIHSKACRLQIWVKSSVVGTYSINLTNSAITRQYVSSFTIIAANTWEQKSFDITMDSSGTWLFDNNLGLDIRVNLQVGSGGQTGTLNSWQTTAAANLGANSHANLWAGTAGATFLMTGVSLYEGSFSVGTILPFKRAGKNIQQELSMCQRYAYIVPNNNGFEFMLGMCYSATSGILLAKMPMTMRAAPAFSSVTSSPIGSFFGVINASGGGVTLSSLVIGGATADTVRMALTTASSLVGGNATQLYPITGSSILGFEAEL